MNPALRKLTFEDSQSKGGVKGSEGRLFQNKSFVTALGLSVLWHAFWFFSLTISVNPSKKIVKNRPKIVSLGPVLDDKIFRTLIENKPELSTTFYRRLSDFSSPVEIQTKTAERYTPGSVVSLPFGKKSWNRVRGLIGGSKVSPEHEFISKIKIGFTDEALGVEGELKNRPVLSRPGEPIFPIGMDPGLKNSEVTIEFTVDISGMVGEAHVASSSGSPDLDLLWVRYLRQWQFAPLTADQSVSNQKGTIKCRFPRGAG